LTWSELLAQATDPLQSQCVLDVALAAVAASCSTALDAEIVADLPTPTELCAVLDGHGVPAPVGSAAELYRHAESLRLNGLSLMPQELRLANHGVS
jgi:hypothetical protein